MQSTCTSLSLWIGMERTLYLWRSSEEKVEVDLHLFVLVDRDGADVVFVPQLRRRRLQSTCTSSSLRIGMGLKLRRVLDCS